MGRLWEIGRTFGLSKVVNGSGGATLLKDLELIYQGVKVMRISVLLYLPVMVKVRLGWDSDDKKI